MKRFFQCLLATFGLTTACGQQNFETTDVQGFSLLTDNPNVVILDVRTASEYAEGHIEGAIHLDQGQSDFVEQAKAQLPSEKTIAVYCKRGRRSASAAERLAAVGYTCVSLNGGINAWKEAYMPLTTSTYRVDVFQTKSGKPLKIQALMHASIRMQFDGKEIEIDPVTKLGNRTIDYTSMPKADYIFVTHEHADHYDPNAIALLSAPHTRLVTNKRCADMLSAGTVMNNGDKQQFGDLEVEAIPAYNTTEGHLQFHPKGRDNGYLLTINGLRIYVAGDTEEIPEMAELKDIDIAFLPCNQPYTMKTEQLIKAAKTIHPRVLFPYHSGQTNLSDIPAQLTPEGIDVRLRPDFQ